MTNDLGMALFTLFSSSMLLVCAVAAATALGISILGGITQVVDSDSKEAASE